MLTRLALSIALLTAIGVWGQPQALVANGGFEAVTKQTPGADGLVAGWDLGDAPQIPTGWMLNTAYPGRLTVGDEAAHSGDRFARILSPEGGSSHLYQMLSGLEGGKWYRVTVWVRGGPLLVHFYEYFTDRPIGGQTVISGKASPDEWRVFEAFYHTPTEAYLRSALAVYTTGGNLADVDDVSIEEITLAQIPDDAEMITYESRFAELSISSDGRLASLRSKDTGEEYSSAGTPFPLLTATRGGGHLPVHSITRDGDVLNLRFLDPDVTASVRVTPRDTYFLIEVMSVEPQDVDRLKIEFPVRTLEKVGSAFNATYDDDFGVCLFGATVNTRNAHSARGSDIRMLGGVCERSHGMVGAKFALVAAPRESFAEAIMQAEWDNGLPCPMLDGKWARESEPVRTSYLFATGVIERDVDTLIEYAKIGGFGTLIFLKNDWLANHGHFDINAKSFPSGLAGVQEAVRKIHAAGLYAGVHVFGPSISPNDPYITPVPDDRLAFVPCPPLAQAIDASQRTIELASQPDLPPKTVRTKAFPGNHIRIGDELIRYGDIEAEAPYRLVDCQRGSLGTAAAAHPAGAEVKGLLTMWSYFLVDPDSTLADEVTQNFADVFNECDFDMAYFDASDGIQSVYLDRWYYLNKMHLGFYTKLKKDVLYQTSTGTGSDILWHIVPRSASADGHGDIKGYLDNRWPGILRMADNFTKADIGWYYWFRDVRPDQIEYVCAKAIGVDGSISLETSREAMQRLSQTRQMFEMIARYEKCRAADYFGEEIRQRLREPKKDFKLFPKGEGAWELHRAVYEEPRTVDVLDGEGNVWTINNDRDEPCGLGVEIVRGKRAVAIGEYDDPQALTIETFDAREPYEMSPRNDFEKFVVGGGKTLTETGPARSDVTQTFELSDREAKVGGSCMVYSAKNAGPPGGWSGIGRRFDELLDLSGYKGIGMWIHGDGAYETLRIQFRDADGRNADFLPNINFKGWRLFTFQMPGPEKIDWSRVAYLLLYFNGLSPNSSARVMIDDVRALRDVAPISSLAKPILTVNGQSVEFPVTLEPGQSLTCEGPLGVTLWPGGMTPGRDIALQADLLQLQPGENRIELSCASLETFPGDTQVILYRMWPMEP